MNTYTATISSQGQASIPKALRERAGITKNSIIIYEFDEPTGNIIIKRPISLAEIRARNMSYIKPGTPPLRDFRKWYEANWEPDSV